MASRQLLAPLRRCSPLSITRFRPLSTTAIVGQSNTIAGKPTTTTEDGSLSNTESENASTTASSSSPSPNDSVPWYLQDPDVIQAQSQTRIEPMPELPPNPPDNLKTLCSQMVQDLGLVDVDIIDLRDLDPPASVGPDALMVVASGKSDRHLIRAANGLHKWIKNEFGIVTDREGIVTANFQRVHQRRQRKKAQRQFFYTKQTDDGVLQRTNSWVVLDTKIDGMVVHLFTPARRQEVSLDELWRNWSMEEAAEALEDSDSVEKPGEFRRGPSSSSSSSSKTSSKSPIGYSKRQFHTSRALTDAAVEQKHQTASPVSAELLSKHSSEGDFAQSVRLGARLPDSDDLVLKSHINYLSMLLNGKLENHSRNITRDSAVVKSFMESFPEFPDAYHWRVRLVFLQHLHNLNPQEFPLRMIVDYLITQQASGIPINKWDVETAVTTIAYSKQRQNPSSNPSTSNKRSARSQWEHECNERFQLIFDLFSVAYRSSGTSFSASDTLLTLMYRMCILESGSYISCKKAISDPTPGSPKRRGFLDRRALTIFKLQDDEKSNKTLIVLALTALANDAQWNKFWIIWKELTLTKQIDSAMLSHIVSLVTKTSNEEAITHMIDYYLPEVLMTRQDAITPQLLNAIKAGLEYVNPKHNGYHYLRSFIERAEEKL